LLLTGLGDQSDSSVPTAAEADGEFADFTSFQATSTPPSLASQSTVRSQLVPKTEAHVEMSCLTGCQPVVPSSYSPVVCGEGVSEKYQTIKELVSNPSLFMSSPLPASGLPEDGNSEWSDYQGLSSANVVHFGIQNSSGADFRPSPSPDDDDWADFQGTSAAGVSKTDQTVDKFQDTALSSLPDFDTEEQPVKTKLTNVGDYSNAAGWFGARQNVSVHCKPSHALFSSGALDFSPPELPLENDDDDTNDLGFYSVCGVDGGQGISSLSTVDFEDEPVESVQTGGGFLKSSVCGMTTSNSTSSFEFTGWRQDLKQSLSVPGADTQSASSLDFRLNTAASKRLPNYNQSQLAAEDDSQSERSFEFVSRLETTVPPSGVPGADFDRMSLQSLELKSAIVSPDDDSSYGIVRDDTVQAASQSLGTLDNAPIKSTGMLRRSLTTKH